jgi:hypothetical protein
VTLYHLTIRLPLFCLPCDDCRYEDKEVQRDKKLVSYDIVNKATKPYIKVKVNGEEKVCDRSLSSLTSSQSLTAALQQLGSRPLAA